eukprot:gene11134-23272_t
MSSFEYLILGAPYGFSTGCTELSGFVLNNELKAIDLFMKQMSNSYKNESGKSNIGHIDLTVQYLVRACKSAIPSVTADSMDHTLQTCTNLSISAINAFIHSYNQISENNVFIAIKSLSLQSEEMVDFKWKINIAMGSNNCASLLHTFVLLSIIMRDHRGNLKTHVIELTPEEFKAAGLLYDLLSSSDCAHRSIFTRSNLCDRQTLVDFSCLQSNTLNPSVFSRSAARYVSSARFSLHSYSQCFSLFSESWLATGGYLTTKGTVKLRLKWIFLST